MTINFRTIGIVVAFVAGVLITRNLFPKKEIVVAPPRITTVHDTVKVLDTLWRNKIIKQTKWDTIYTERVTHTKPDTLYIVPRLTGLTFLNVPNKVGDSTIAQGFQVAPGDSNQVITGSWQVQWWTPGPLRTLAIDSAGVPLVAFYPTKTVHNCNWLCATKHYVLGGIFGMGIEVARGCK